MIYVQVEALTKRFNRQEVFRDVSFEVAPGSSLVVCGPNGSGKSTLLKILLGLLPPTRGVVRFREGERELERDALRGRVSFVAPYLQFYGALTGYENLQFLARLQGRPAGRACIEQALARVGLEGQGRKLVKAYSSGMQQRLKYALGWLIEPHLVVLDEPTANLDVKGKQFVQDWIERIRGRCALIIATNEPDELNWGEQRLELGL